MDDRLAAMMMSTHMMLWVLPSVPSWPRHEDTPEGRSTDWQSHSLSSNPNSLQCSGTVVMGYVIVMK